jgi:Xaa-Pro aminopeptidase
MKVKGSNAVESTAIQAAVREAGFDGWLFYDFRRSNPIAHRVLDLPPHQFFSRRWFYWVPAAGEPAKVVSAVESHVLDALPGQRHVYNTWQVMRQTLQTLMGGARRVAMEYVPDGGNPYVSIVDAGTVEMVRALGPEVVSSGDMAQRFEAVLTPAQIASHRAAGAALLRARDGIFAWVRDQLRAEVDLTEYSIQQEFARLMRAEGLAVGDEDKPLVAVNGNAGNPHYSPTAQRHAPARPGDLLLLDFSAPLAGEGNVVADYTWMAVLGERVPEWPAQLFVVIRDARDLGVALLREHFEQGKPLQGYMVDDAVRAHIAQAGYGAAFLHRTGHNIGTTVHGRGAHLDNLETHDTRTLLANTCTSMEPGIYLPDDGIGVRTEVDVLLLPGGIEVTGEPAQTEILPLLA